MRGKACLFVVGCIRGLGYGLQFSPKDFNRPRAYSKRKVNGGRFIFFLLHVLNTCNFDNANFLKISSSHHNPSQVGLAQMHINTNLH